MAARMRARCQSAGRAVGMPRVYYMKVGPTGILTPGVSPRALGVLRSKAGRSALAFGCRPAPQGLSAPGGELGAGKFDGDLVFRCAFAGRIAVGRTDGDP